MELINDLKISRWVGEFLKRSKIESCIQVKAMKFDGMPLASANQLGISQADSYLPGRVRLVGASRGGHLSDSAVVFLPMGVPMVDALDPKHRGGCGERCRTPVYFFDRMKGKGKIELYLYLSSYQLFHRWS